MGAVRRHRPTTITGEQHQNHYKTLEDKTGMKLSSSRFCFLTNESERGKNEIKIHCNEPTLRRREDVTIPFSKRHWSGTLASERLGEKSC